MGKVKRMGRTVGESKGLSLRIDKTEEELRLSEERYRKLIDMSPDGVWVRDESGRVIFINASGAKLLGAATPEDLIGKTFLDYTYPDDRNLQKESIKKVTEAAKGITKDLIEERFRRLDGTMIVVQLFASSIIYQGRPAIQVYAHDITELKRAEEQMQLSAEKLSTIFRTSPTAMSLVRAKDGQIIDANESFMLLTGEDVIGKNGLLPGIFWANPDDGTKAWQIICSDGKLRDFEVAFHAKSGEARVALLSAERIYVADGPHYISSWVDITERKRVEDELRRSQREIRNLSVHLQSVREQERVAMARKIHDDLGQNLAALKMELGLLRSRLSGDENALDDRVKSMIVLVDNTILTTQRIYLELRPRILDDLGLVSALGWQAREFEQRYEITCHLKRPRRDVDVNKELAITVFRICQEALTNVARHSSATNVEIGLRTTVRDLVMNIRDNGKGITEEQLSSSQSFGLLGMRERAAALGGKIDVRGIPGKGTTVKVCIPLEHLERDND